ncbi:Deoxyribose-phosphate aldolase [Syntrophobotulus glycolicus DSM 8271]|uniref:Deoxyribose-phosphate aldolase n=1 Tax=Syntrophobotulus glycolicus (strain DSM 8271 / FlGlyR) TaxID=645991 RepID=F0T2U0_SYNGF|nr:deoxyribose-phosphate aldolase [Syntrophobotulus glycolicus]ADY57577.1 Deoxyribose-phosphate aldolase [Syntrophobotulus glycolicus DSM 8271]
MKNLSVSDLPRIIDISCVKSHHRLEEIDKMIAAAKTHQFICIFALPSFTAYLIEQLKDEPEIMVGGTVGFPSGCDTTAAKVFQAKELLNMGCDELDMVINISQLKSQNDEFVFRDIKAVTDVAEGKPVKAILEVTLLTDEEIVRASKIAMEAGVSFIKTSTGWLPEPTTVRHIKLIKAAIQNKTKIKAAGGIRDLSILLEMMEAGCSRFGIGLSSAIKIMEKARG